MTFLWRLSAAPWMSVLCVALGGVLASSAAAQSIDAGVGPPDAGVPLVDAGAPNATSTSVEAVPPPPVAEIPAAPTITAPTRVPASTPRPVPTAPRTTAPRPQLRALLPGRATRHVIYGHVSASAYSIYPSSLPAGPWVPASSSDEPLFIGTAADASVGWRSYFAPVRDDAAPRSLQPFLQRASSVQGQLSIAGFSTVSRGLTRGTRNYSLVAAWGGFDAYVTRSLTVSAWMNYGYSVLNDKPTVEQQHSASAGAAVGLRLGDAHVGISYDFTARVLRGQLTKARWGAAELSTYWVFARAYSLLLAARLSDMGAGGRVGVSAYTSKEMGLHAGVSGGTRTYLTSDTQAEYYAFDLGLSYWTASTMRFVFSYFFQYVHFAASMFNRDQYEHGLALSAELRLP